MNFQSAEQGDKMCVLEIQLSLTHAMASLLQVSSMPALLPPPDLEATRAGVPRNLEPRNSHGTNDGDALHSSWGQITAGQERGPMRPVIEEELGTK